MERHLFSSKYNYPRRFALLAISDKLRPDVSLGASFSFLPAVWQLQLCRIIPFFSASPLLPLLLLIQTRCTRGYGFFFVFTYSPFPLLRNAAVETRRHLEASALHAVATGLAQKTGTMYLFGNADCPAIFQEPRIGPTHGHTQTPPPAKSLLILIGFNQSDDVILGSLTHRTKI